GRHAEALDAAEEAVEIYRRLVADNSAAYEPDLAHSLTNLGLELSPAGRHAEALDAAEEAVEIYRRLVADNSAAYEPDLAISLSTLGLLLIEMEGDLSRVLRLIGEAVELYRRHIATTPTLLPKLHPLLQMQASVLVELGCLEDAEAVRRWIRENPLPPSSHN
ncbi:tetratricopeptide repeat protein, partial [Stenotrophomonas sp. NPDC087984]